VQEQTASGAVSAPTAEFDIIYDIHDRGLASLVSQLEKLYRRALARPGSVRWSELDTLLQRFGFTRRQPGGGSSHYVYTRGSMQLAVPKSGSNSVKAVYVRRVMDALERLQLEEWDDDDS
jgi:hypothetical protein